MKLAGRVAIVTGAASDIRRAIAWEFACEGAAVEAVDIKPLVNTVCSVIQEEGGRAEPRVFDITDQDAYRKCVEEVAGAGGKNRRSGQQRCDLFLRGRSSRHASGRAGQWEPFRLARL